MNILVTGGAGFIGSHIAQAHLNQGDHVVVIDDLSTGKESNIPSGARFIQMDITSPDLSDVFNEEQFDVVNHHAAHMELRVSVDKPMHDASVNVLGSINVLESARRSNVGHCIVASTAAVYGALTQIPADESHPIRPIAPYGVSKRSMELYADYYRITHGMTISTLRYTNVYGPRQNPHGESGVIGIFLNNALEGRGSTIHGDGEQVRDYLYAEDAAAANVLAAANHLNGAYMVCSNTEASVNDVVRHLNAGLGQAIEITNGPAKAGDPPRTRGSYDLLHAATGWKPTVDLAEGIRRTVSSFRNR